jgi:hypothetical protein
MQCIQLCTIGKGTLMQPIITKLNYTYKKPDSDVWVLNTQDIPVDKTLIKDQQIVHFAPLSVGGNHKHPRIEWFVGIGELEFIWLDKNGNKKIQQMNPDGQLLLIEVPPFLPHAVKNSSVEKIGILFELADDTANGVEKIKIL